jgi:hypothetical protein
VHDGALAASGFPTDAKALWVNLRHSWQLLEPMRNVSGISTPVHRPLL